MPNTEQVKLQIPRRHEVLVPPRVTATVRNIGPDPCFAASFTDVSPVRYDRLLGVDESMDFTDSCTFMSAGRSRLFVTTPTRIEQLEADLDAK